MTSDLTVKKLNILFIPFLLISITACIGYTFLNWLLIIRLELFSIKDVLVQMVGPTVLSAVLLLFFRRRMRILNLKTQRKNLPVLYYVILLILLTLPSVIAQFYLPKATGKLTQLLSINEIDQHKPSKYYSLANFAIDKKNVGINSFYSISGKNSSNYNIYIYVVFPIIEQGVESGPCKAFLGVKYFKSISNRLSPREKDENYTALESISKYEIAHNNFDDFRYLERTGNNNDGDGFKDAILHCLKYDRSTAPILIAQKESFEDRLGNQLVWIFMAFGISAIVWLMMVLIPKIDPAELRNFINGMPAKK